ncbi:MAG: hypothetical protein JWO93_3309 [Micrococcaceae bacterium]|nr:hypothetical protein [Micrococcaceae bacterium]
MSNQSSNPAAPASAGQPSQNPTPTADHTFAPSAPASSADADGPAPDSAAPATEEPQAEPVRPVIAAAAAKRANASVIGMVMALLVSLAVVLPVVLFNARPNAQSYRAEVDVAAVAAQASDAAGFLPVSPALPAGWSTNYARWNSAGSDGVAFWEVGYVSPTQQFISLTQTADANPTWLAQRTSNAPVTGDRPVDGVSWELRDKPDADHSLLLDRNGTTLILTGTGDLKDFDVLAAAAATAAAAGTAPASAPASSPNSTATNSPTAGGNQ